MRKALGDWGFDGLKIDGQHLNGARPATTRRTTTRTRGIGRGLPEFCKTIYETARAISRTRWSSSAPAAPAYSFFTLPYMNMPSPPIRVLLAGAAQGQDAEGADGRRVAYSGDHVELSEGGDDFASTVGVGGVVGHQVHLAADRRARRTRLLLTPSASSDMGAVDQALQREAALAGRLSRRLYDIGFDRPEAHAIRKDGALYYAFYANASRDRSSCAASSGALPRHATT